MEDTFGDHLWTLDDLPVEFMIPPTVVLTRESAERVLRELESTAEPTRALQTLLRADEE